MPLERHAVQDAAHTSRWIRHNAKYQRDVTLIRIVPNPNPGATLPYIAEFDGPDAHPLYWTPTQPW